MARLLIFTDRKPEDGDWKGWLIWQIIQSLAESQHEVLVATPLAPELMTVTHPRLTVARPVHSWRADQIVPLTQILFTYRPEVIQTFAPEPSRLWPALSVWPYLQGLMRTFPQVRRISTLFDEDDFVPTQASFRWHQSADTVTVFSERQRTRSEIRLGRQATVLPMELSRVMESELNLEGVIVPAPVSEWSDPETGLERLVRFCNENPDKQVHIVGGWGDWSTQQRRSGWARLQSVASRLHLHADFSFADFTAVARNAEMLWLEPLRQDSWRYLAATHLGSQFGRKMHLPGSWAPSVNVGSTANALSRIYAGKRKDIAHLD